MGCGKNDDLNQHTGFAIQTLAIGNWKVSNHENCQQKGVWASKIFWPDHLSTSSKTRMTQLSGEKFEKKSSRATLLINSSSRKLSRIRIFLAPASLNGGSFVWNSWSHHKYMTDWTALACYGGVILQFNLHSRTVTAPMSDEKSSIIPSPILGFIAIWTGHREHWTNYEVL